MDLKKKCSFYQSCENLNVGRGIGYCDVDGGQPTCDGDTNFCEKPDVLKRCLKNSSEFAKKESKGG